MTTELQLPPPAETPATKFPVLARGKLTNVVVLFDGPESGTVLIVNRYSSNPVGYYSKNWNPVKEDYYWEILPAGTKLVITQ